MKRSDGPGAWMRWVGCLCLLGGALRAARADAILVMEEPVNLVGRMTSSGHAAVWFDKLCSDDHTHMRACSPGEAGAVVSRYQAVANHLDWLAMPPDGYFFAVDRELEIPRRVTREEVARLKARYREAHASSFVVDPGKATWESLLGESYRRKMVLIRVHTTETQDRRMMDWLNGRSNVSHFNIFYSNCGDFVSEMLNVIYPGAIHRQYLLDAGMTTPKQVEAKLHRYALKHPELGWETAALPQVAGTLPRSQHLYGVTESYLKTYWFLLPLDYLLPFELGAVTTLGLCDHRYVARPRNEADTSQFFDNRQSAAVAGR